MKKHRSWRLCAMLAAAAFLSVGCKRDESRAEWWHGEQERTALSQEVKLLQYRLDHSQAKMQTDLEHLDGRTQADALLLQGLRQKLSDLSSDVAKLQSDWSDFKSSILREQRQLAIGKSHPTFQLATGRTFQDVSVVAIHDAGVTIRHADGSARLRFEDLNTEQQAYFGLEEHLALAAEEKESLTTATYERGIDTQMALIQQQEKLVADITRREEQAARQKWSQLAAQYVAASVPSTLSQAATPVGRDSWSSYRYDRYHRYRTRYPYDQSVYYYYASSINYCRTPVPSPVVRPTASRRATPAVTPQKVSVIDNRIRSIR